MGILDSKTRILDTLITNEGRKQMSNGKLKIEWISLTDTATFYEADLVSGSTDATKRIFLEACNLPQDQITFEADDSGKLMPFKNDRGITVKSGKLFSNSFNVTGSYDTDLTLIENDQFASLASSLLSSSLDNFQKLQLLSTIDPIFEDSEFLSGPNSINYTITDEYPISNVAEQSANINHLESFFQDRRLMHIENFMYLPPITRVKDNNLNLENESVTRAYRIGEYPSFGPSQKTDYSYFSDELSIAERTGFCKTVRFDPTSHDNRLALQFFEIRKNDILKLDVIDYGTHSTGDDQFPMKKVFFVGKIMLDDNKNYTFIHLFTLVFE